jgi:hypothetical protein
MAANAPTDDDKEQAKQQTLAIRLLHGINDNHKACLIHLCNSHIDGTDVYPPTSHEAYHILQPREEQPVTTISDTGGLAFATVGQTGRIGRDAESGRNAVEQGAADLTRTFTASSPQCPSSVIVGIQHPLAGDMNGSATTQARIKMIALPSNNLKDLLSQKHSFSWTNSQRWMYLSISSFAQYP